MSVTTPSQPHTDAATPAVDLDYEVSKGFAHRYIRFRCRKLIGRYGYTKADLPDLQQDLKLHLVQRFSQFDPTIKSWRVFVVMVIRTKISNLVEACRRIKRDQHGREVSLSEMVKPAAGPSTEMADTITLDDVARLTGEFDRPASEWSDLEYDVAAAIAKLPRRLRRACKLLQKHSVSDTARKMRVSRVRMYEMLHEIRRELIPHGIHLYRRDVLNAPAFETEEQTESLR